MPSQIAHALCAQDVFHSLRAERSGHAPRVQDALITAHLFLGAQGPDLFYHNLRRRPTGIQYGTLLHRRGYGSLVAGMISHALENGWGPESPTGAYITAYITHAILDRRLHPYINYRAGRPVSGEPQTEQYRSMHAFLERLIDVALLRYLRDLSINDFSFYEKIEPMVTADPTGLQWINLTRTALTMAFERARADTKIEDRLSNAWADATGYFQFTSRVTPEYLAAGIEREAQGEIRSMWLSIVHPPNVPDDIDVLNLGHTEWIHPCSSRRRSTASVVEMYRNAVSESIDIVADVIAVWQNARTRGSMTVQQIASIAERIGDYNLSDGRPRRRPCLPRHMEPLPLFELQQRIRASIRRGDGGVV